MALLGGGQHYLGRHLDGLGPHDGVGGRVRDVDGALGLTVALSRLEHCSIFMFYFLGSLLLFVIAVQLWPLGSYGR